MIIHCSKKLAGKLSLVASEALTETSPLGSWHAHVYTFNRYDCLLLCHDETRYTVFLPRLRKADYAALEHLFRESFKASLAYMDIPDVQIRKAELMLGKMVFDSCTDRSVLGTLNKMHFMLQARVEEVQNVLLLDPLEVTRWLCHTPVSVRGKYSWPDEAMTNRVMAL